jgi:hypothetical protein
MEMRQSRAIAIAETYAQEISAVYARAELGVNISELVSKANRGEQLSDTEFFALSEYINSRYLHSFFNLLNQDFLGRATRGPIFSFSSLICRNPGLRQIWAIESRNILENAGQRLKNFASDMNGAIGEQCGE